MTTAYRLYTLIIILLSIISPNLQSEDSIPMTELKEIEVTSERSWISDDGTINFIPTKKEKRLSNSPGTLIESMHLPLLRREGDNIINATGESVTVFINGERAEQIDIATFWPNEVMTVQYVENPKDPRFEGYSYVVNFIIKRYAAGGVCRTNATQILPNNGNYMSSAKLTYKKMTYGVMIMGLYSRDHRSGASGETSYKDLYYDENHYDDITRIEDSRSYDRTDVINCAMNARYADKTFRATHTLSLDWHRKPGSGSSSVGSWSDNLFGSDVSSSEYSSKHLSPQISGNYYKIFSDKWYLSWKWNYMHTDITSNSMSITGNNPEVWNRTQEHINTAIFNIRPSFLLSDKIYFQLLLDSRFDWSRTSYSGSLSQTLKQRRNASSASISFGWTPTDNLQITLRPGLGITGWNIGDIHEQSVYPTANASVIWTLSRKISLDGSLQFATKAPSAIESNPTVLRISELLWNEGNPYLKHQSNWDAYFTASYIVSKNLSLLLGMGYDRSINPIIASYQPASADLGGLVKKNENCSPSEGIRTTLPISLTSSDHNLSLVVTPYWRYSHVINGPSICVFNYVSFSAKASYSFGNCRVGIAYQGPRKGMDISGREKTWTQDNWDFYFTYGIQNLYVNLGMENIFHNKALKNRNYTSAYFCSRQNTYTTGRKLSLTLTYTFGFGRKVDRGIDISGPETINSNVSLTQ